MRVAAHPRARHCVRHCTQRVLRVLLYVFLCFFRVTLRLPPCCRLLCKAFFALRSRCPCVLGLIFERFCVCLRLPRTFPQTAGQRERESQIRVEAVHARVAPLFFPIKKQGTRQRERAASSDRIGARLRLPLDFLSRWRSVEPNKKWRYFVVFVRIRFELAATLV